MNIKAILNIIHSKRDRAGNCYFAFTYNDDRGTAFGTVSGGESNIRAVELVMNGGQWPSSKEPRFYVTVHEKAIREFNRETKDWPYAGCAPEDIAKFINGALTRPVENVNGGFENWR